MFVILLTADGIKTLFVLSNKVLLMMVLPAECVGKKGTVKIIFCDSFFFVSIQCQLKFYTMPCDHDFKKIVVFHLLILFIGCTCIYSHKCYSIGVDRVDISFEDVIFYLQVCKLKHSSFICLHVHEQKIRPQFLEKT